MYTAIIFQSRPAARFILNRRICSLPEPISFGPRITVSGLLTGQDIMEQLKGRDLGSQLLLPVNVLRSGEDVLLDDVHISEIEKTLQVPVRIVQSNGKDLYEALLS